jgi:hypothetical protein
VQQHGSGEELPREQQKNQRQCGQTSDSRNNGRLGYSALKVDHAGRCYSFRPKLICQWCHQFISLSGVNHQIRCRAGFVDARRRAIRQDVRSDQSFGEFAIFDDLNWPRAEGDELFIGIDSELVINREQQVFQHQSISRWFRCSRVTGTVNKPASKSTTRQKV